MADGIHQYAFDIMLKTAVRIEARSLREAKDKLIEALNCATVNLGETDDGQTLVAEASIDGEPELFEFDGEPAHDINGNIKIGETHARRERNT